MKNLPILAIAALLAGCGGQASQQNQKAEQQIPFAPVTGGTVYVTAQGTDLRLTPNGELTFTAFDQPMEAQPFVFVDPNVTFQTMTGIGGAITDAAAETFAKMSPETQQELLTAYYDPEKGIGYNMARTTIASSDFGSDTYSYIQEGDTTLSTFSLAHDEMYRLPLLREVVKCSGDSMLVIATPWSPPAWMKSNNNMLRGGTLLDPYKQVWANHFVKFIEAYEAAGIPIWAISSQNETMAVQTWESCVYTAQEERDFIRDYLGPTLEKSPYKDVKLLAWDHNRDLIFQRAATIMADPEAAKYVWGFAFHWYEPWTGGDMQFNNLRMVKEAFPDKQLLFTEGCVEKFDLKRIDDWTLGERYGYSMLNDFNCGTVAWTDWNILLDEQGGPNHVGNYCFAPVHFNTQTGELIYTNSYYYIGHFSKFIQRGAKRIGVSSSRYALQATGFLNPDGTIVLMMLNRSDDQIDFKLGIQEKAADMVSLPHSIMTVVLK